MGGLLLELDELAGVPLELDVEELLLLELGLSTGNVTASTQPPMYGPGSSVPVSASGTIGADT
jgi:hypothetical protein